MATDKRKQPLLVLLGPTACGKTGLSLEIASYFDAEIISGDSIQIYKGLDIGSAKPSKEELAQDLQYAQSVRRQKFW